MLELKSVSWRNFLSYGDYDNTLDLTNLGQCLISGQVIDDDKDIYDDANPMGIRKSNGAGKCLAEGTLVLLQNGKRVPIEQLNQYLGSDLIGIDDNFRSTTSKLINHCCSGVKTCYKMITASGREIICSKNHRFLRINGWTSLRDLQQGDHIATNRSLNITTQPTPYCLESHEAELLGLLLGDGTFTKYTPSICISDDEPETKCLVEKLIKYFDNDMRLSSSPSNKNRKGKNYRIIINDQCAAQKVNPVARLVQNLGLTGCTKQRKFIPQIIYEMPESVWINIISGFWQADGWVSICTPQKNRKPRISVGCSNKSKNIVYSIQHLLLRLGIRSKIRFKHALCTTKTRHSSWVLEVTADSYQLFIDTLKFDKIRKNYEEISDIRSKIAKHARLRNLGNSDVLWDKIISITNVGPTKTYDIEVTTNGEPNFSANDIITHNSTIPSVIQWVLFGRTMHAHNPGSKVLNWFTDKNCWGRVEFKDGDSIERIRTTAGKTELIYIRNGNEERTVADTLSTAVNQQAQVSKRFDLDWDFFCGSVFFNQYNKPWLEMADQSRRKAIERILHVDRYTYRAKISKGKYDTIETAIARQKQTIADIERETARLEGVIERLKISTEEFEHGRQDRKRKLLTQALEEKNRRDAIIIPDLDKLRQKWDLVKQIQDKLRDLEAQELKLYQTISKLEGSLRSVTDRINTWTKKSGKMCTNCEQTIAADHVSARVEPLTIEKDEIKDKIKESEEKRTKLKGVITTVKKTVENKKPEHTIRDATRIHDEYKRLTREIKRLKTEANKKEDNPHKKSLDEAQRNLTEQQTRLATTEDTIERDIFRARHYYYIFKAYNDRNKIKSFAFQEHIPFINGRLKHYLDVFGLDIEISLTATLGIASNLWGYEFESGGERKRTDVAFMLAMFDFHEHMYGRQCNVLVLDEVDGRLDDDGIDSLINIIKTDLANRAESVLIISHKDHMQDTFPMEIRVVRKDRFSRMKIA